MGEQFKCFSTAFYGVNMVAVQVQREAKQVPSVGLIFTTKMR